MSMYRLICCVAIDCIPDCGDFTSENAAFKTGMNYMMVFHKFMSGFKVKEVPDPRDAENYRFILIETAMERRRLLGYEEGHGLAYYGNTFDYLYSLDKTTLEGLCDAYEKEIRETLPLAAVQ